jgi:cytochrome b6-f complex iron-sulfur subunit
MLHCARGRRRNGAQGPTHPRSMNDRRRFLQVFGAAALVLGAGVPLGCASNAAQQGQQPHGLITGPLAKDVAVNSLTPVGGQAVVLGRDSGGLYAMTAICTHMQCDMENSGTVSASGLSCSCHGSQFDANGAVVSGPASSPLAHFEVRVETDGTVTINADNIVASSVRTPVPT